MMIPIIMREREFFYLSPLLILEFFVARVWGSCGARRVGRILRHFD